MRTSNILASFLLVLILIGLSGCGETPNDSNEEMETKTAEEQPELEPEETLPDEPSDIKDLKDILAGNIKYKVSYEVVSEGQTDIITMAYDMPKFVQSSMAEEGESKTIFDGENIIVCTKDEEEEWQCIKMASAGDAETPNSLQTEESIKEGEFLPVHTGSCNVAGEKGLQYEVSAEGYTTSVCYTTDGIMLEMKTEEMRMTATSVSRSVSASEFVPPAEPQDLSAMLANLPEMPEQ